MRAEPSAAVECPAGTSSGDPGKVEASIYLERAKAAVDLSQWATAEACLDAGEILEPKNRDFIFFRARVKAFQGRHDEALAIAQPWPTTDTESRELRGDLAWYRGDAIDAEKWYRSNLSPEAPVTLWKTWLKALKAKGDLHFPSALNVALARFPADPDLLAMAAQPFVPLTPAELDTLKNENLKAIEADLEKEIIDEPPLPSPLVLPKGKGVKKAKKTVDLKPKCRAAIGATLMRETQDQRVHSEDADAAVIANRKSLAIGVSSITRDYGPVTFTDNPFRLALGIGFPSSSPRLFQSQETTFTLGGASHPTFTPLRFGMLRHEVFFSDNLAFWGEIGAKWYPGLYARTAILGAEYTRNRFRYQAKIFNTRARQSDTAGLLSAAYLVYKLVPEFYMLGGRDAASRPYLFDREDDAFLAAGFNLSYRFAAHWAIRSTLEQRTESGFRQQTLSLVLLWYDR